MSVNKKLTSILKGDIVTSADANSASFKSGRRLSISGTLSGNGIPVGAVVHSVIEAATDLVISFDGTNAQAKYVLADPGGSVMVRDADHKVVYAG